MFRLVLVYCLLNGALSQEYGLPVTGGLSEVYNQPQDGSQIQNQAQGQDDKGNNALQSSQQEVSSSGDSDQPYQAAEEIQQELPYQGPSGIQQEQELLLQPQEPQPQVGNVVQLAEAPQQPAETYGLPPESGQGSDVSLDHPLDEEPQQVVQTAEPSPPPAQPSEVYGLPPDGQSLPVPRQNYKTGAYNQNYQLNPSFGNQRGVFRQGTQYQNYVNKYDSGSQSPNQYQKYPTQPTNEYRRYYQSQESLHKGQHQLSINQYHPISHYQTQNRQDIQYSKQDQRFNQDQQSRLYQNNNRQQQQSYRDSNEPSQSWNSYPYQNYNQYPKYTKQYSRERSQYYQNPAQYQQNDQRQQYSALSRNEQPSVYKQSHPGSQSGHRISSQFETSNYISQREPNANDFSASTPGTIVSTHLSRGYQDVQTSKLPMRYILLFQRNQAAGTPETSSVSYQSRPIPQRQRSKIQEVDSLPILVETDEAPIAVLPVPRNFHQGSSYGSASSTFVSKDSPGYQQQPRLDSYRNEQRVNSADIRQLSTSLPLTSYGLPRM